MNIYLYPGNGNQGGLIRVFLLLTVGFLLFIPRAHSFDHGAWDKLLKTYVVQGRVNYTGWLGEQDSLKAYLKRLDELPLSAFADFSREERMAIWINVFNASVVEVILNHSPVGSIEEITGFWEEKRVRLAGMRYSLQEVRDRVFRQGFRDERALLALVAGTRSSPPLRSEAYEAAALTDQLKDQMKIFLEDERFNQIRPYERELFLSPLFLDFSEDFLLGYGSHEEDLKFSSKELSVLSFIRLHLDDPEKKTWIEKRTYQLAYLPNDTQLNTVQASRQVFL